MKSPRMTLDEIVNRIVEEKGLSRRQVYDLIEKKKGLLSHMISEEGAADIVAKELGVNTRTGNEDEELALEIGDLVPGMSNVTITGRTDKINPTKEFLDKTGGKGIVASLVIIDKSSEIRVVLWGETARLVQDNKIKEGSIIRIHDGYVKEDLGGRAELHVGRRGHVEVDPSDAPETDFPHKPSKFRKISELTPDMTKVDLRGTVRVVDAMRMVRTKEERELRLSSIIMEDETGTTIRVVLWDDKAPLVTSMKKGDNLEITSGRVRIGKNGGIEVHVGSGARVEVSPTGRTSTIVEDRVTVKISQLRIGMHDFSLEGCVSEEPQFREFTRADGTSGKILSFILSDNSARIRAVAWGENAEKLRKIKQGEIVRISDPNLKLGIRGEHEAHIKSFETVDLLDGKENTFERERLEANPEETKARDQSAPRRELRALLDAESAEIRGIITKVHTRSPFYSACPKCFRKVEWKEDRWQCPRDGNIENPTIRVLYSLTLDDGTGTITCTLSGAPGAELLGIKASEMPLVPNEKKHYDFSGFSNILGMEIVLTGKCIFNRNQSRKEFRVSGVTRPDPRAEAKILLEHIRNDFPM